MSDPVMDPKIAKIGEGRIGPYRRCPAHLWVALGAVVAIHPPTRAYPRQSSEDAKRPFGAIGAFRGTDKASAAPISAEGYTHGVRPSLACAAPGFRSRPRRAQATRRLCVDTDAAARRMPSTNLRIFGMLPPRLAADAKPSSCLRRKIIERLVQQPSHRAKAKLAGHEPPRCRASQLLHPSEAASKPCAPTATSESP